MFTREIKFAGDCVIKWFNEKYIIKNIELSIRIKRKYEVENPIDWELGHCCICKFPLKVNPTNFDATVNNMSHPNFINFREYKVLRNLSEQELSSRESLKNIEEYHKKFQNFLKMTTFYQTH